MNSPSPKSIVELVHTKHLLSSETPTKEVSDYFTRATHDFVAIVENDMVCGLVGRETLLRKVGTQFGWSLYADKPVKKLAHTQALIVDAGIELVSVMKRALARPAEHAFDDVIITSSGSFCGLVSVRTMMIEHLQILEEELRQREAQRLAAIEKNRELVEANLRLMRTQGTNRTNLEQSTVPICTVEKNGIVSTTNDAFCRLSGHKREEIQGSPVSVLFPLGYEEELQHYLQNASSEERTSYHLQLKQKDGEKKWIEIAFEVVAGTGQLLLNVIDVADQAHQATQEVLNQHYRSGAGASGGGAGEVIARRLASRMLSGTKAEHLVPKLHALAGLADKIEETERASKANPSGAAGAGNRRFQGDLNHFTPIDLAQLLVHGRKSGVLILERENQRYLLALNQGRLYHAQTSGGSSGLGALGDFLSQTKGNFEFHADLRLQESTLTGDSMSLLMEACRQTDELAAA